jgi:hypothetical protein
MWRMPDIAHVPLNFVNLKAERASLKSPGTGQDQGLPPPPPLASLSYVPDQSALHLTVQKLIVGGCDPLFLF